MLRRTGVSLLEVLISVAILAVLIGFVLVAVQKVRAASLRTQSSNNLRQIVLGVHQLADLQEGRIKNLPQSTPKLKPLYTEQSIFGAILPFTCPERPAWSPGTMTLEQQMDYTTPRVKIYLSPADPTLTAQFSWFVEAGEPIRDRCSYVANMLAFDGVHQFPVSVPDGTNGTLAFAEHYFLCGLNRAVWLEYTNVLPPVGSPSGGRRATFADRAWATVMPTKDPATGQTVSSVPGMTFQLRPKPEDADYRVPQTPHPGGLPVALFDGSVKTLSPSIEEHVFWSLVTPNGGEAIGDF